MSNSGDSDDDWFNKDEEELLKGLKINGHGHEEKTEYVKPPVSEVVDDNYLLNQRLTSASKKHTDKVPKILTSELRKVAESGTALDAFLYVFTQEAPDFFVGQIEANDSMERVLLFMRIFGRISDLKIPGFHREVVKRILINDELLESFRVIATKILSKQYTKCWAKDHDRMRLDKMIADMQTLFKQALKLEIITPKATEIMQHILKLIERTDTTEAVKKSLAEFGQSLREILTIANTTTSNLLERIDVYPTLKELSVETHADSNIKGPFNIPSLLNYEYKSVSDYLQIQQEALRADFMLPLSHCVFQLKQTQKLLQQFASRVLFFEKVRIILNEDFLNARRHEMLFVDVDPYKKQNKDVISMLFTLKTGTLILFSTNYEFENLILAEVTYQDAELSRNGYIAIEVVRQFNIGNIYNKDLIAFTSPSFFEPYHNVYKYLSTCGVEDFAMKDYIVFDKPNVTMPSYLTAETTFEAEKFRFKPAREPPPSTLPFNDSQREAVRKSLTQECTFVQGPPGTGKTHISVQLVKMLVENQTPKPIIVVAYTNESLDKFLLKLSRYTSSIARFGSQTRSPEISKFNVQGIVQPECIHPRLKRLYFMVNTKYKTAFGQLQLTQKDFDGTDEGYQQVLAAQQTVRALVEQLNTLRMLFKYYIVRERAIVALTTTCAAKMNFLLRLLQSRIVVFEEAAEILESHVLACLTPNIEHIIMIGDHMQLKPHTSEHSFAQYCDFNVSLFERLIHRNVVKPAVLLTQYRMRPEISNLLCPIFYEILHNDESVEHYPLVRGMKESLYFVNHSVKEKRSEKDLSLYNEYEAETIAALATYLIDKAKYNCDDIVILSPYAAQVNFIKNQLSSHLQSMRVMTVDSFQGLEATIILLSLVRNNSERNIGFLKEKNRVCVALSRAKHGMYIIGGLDLLVSCNDTWSAIDKKLKSYNLVGTEFPYNHEMIFCDTEL